MEHLAGSPGRACTIFRRPVFDSHSGQLPDVIPLSLCFLLHGHCLNKDKYRAKKYGASKLFSWTHEKETVIPGSVDTMCVWARYHFTTRYILQHTTPVLLLLVAVACRQYSINYVVLLKLSVTSFTFQELYWTPSNQFSTNTRVSNRMLRRCSL